MIESLIKESLENRALGIYPDLNQPGEPTMTVFVSSRMVEPCRSEGEDEMTLGTVHAVYTMRFQFSNPMDLEALFSSLLKDNFLKDTGDNVVGNIVGAIQTEPDDGAELTTDNISIPVRYWLKESLELTPIPQIMLGFEPDTGPDNVDKYVAVDSLPDITE